ncbi:MAG: GntR family transcriptional regulator [Athalassotoga sp.]|uniref:GntR family transcriptional regulator n=1 Tax=Athalassotoga sp. TaxID=2022597 RepID=UPI003D05194E
MTFRTYCTIILIQYGGGSIKIDYHSNVPVYKQIVHEFEDMIISDALKPGDFLPSVRTLALELNVNPNTVAKAFFVLQSNGFIDSKAGVGNYVVKPPPSSVDKRLNELMDEMKALVLKMKGFNLSKEEIIKKMDDLIEEAYDGKSS